MTAAQVAAQSGEGFLTIVFLGVLLVGGVVLGLRAIGGLIDDLFGRRDR